MADFTIPLAGDFTDEAGGNDLTVPLAGDYTEEEGGGVEGSPLRFGSFSLLGVGI